MLVSNSIQTDHKDLIHDVSYDFHGRRMATCSSDQNVKIWDQGEDGEWTCTASWKVSSDGVYSVQKSSAADTSKPVHMRTHSGSVWRVTWAHSEFGQVIATCSFDRTAAVWEEMVAEPQQTGQHRSWIKRTGLVDSRTAVTDVKFAPKHLGLLLATCSLDGIVRIYEAPDVMNLSQWSLQHEISCKLRCSCLTWNPSRRHPPMLAVGSDDPSPSAGGKLQVYEYNESTRKWNKVETLSIIADPVYDIAFAPNLGRSYHLLGIATKTLKIISITPLRRDATLAGPSGLTKFELHQVGDFNDHDSQVWRICWNVIGTVLASSGDDSCVRLWKANYLGNWKCIATMKGDGSRQEAETRSISRASDKETSGKGATGPARMNLRRSDGWPHFNTKKDQSKVNIL